MSQQYTFIKKYIFSTIFIKEHKDNKNILTICYFNVLSSIF